MTAQQQLIKAMKESLREIRSWEPWGGSNEALNAATGEKE